MNSLLPFLKFVGKVALAVMLVNLALSFTEKGSGWFYNPRSLFS